MEAKAKDVPVVTAKNYNNININILIFIIKIFITHFNCNSKRRLSKFYNITSVLDPNRYF